MLATGKSLRLVAKLNPADSTFTADVDIGVTSGRIYFANDDQVEWVSFTGVSANGSYWNYTGLTRGLSQTADPATAGTGLTWLANQEGILVVMHDQLFDKGVDNTLAHAIAFSGTTNSGIRFNNLTTTQRTALTPANGMVVYDTSLGELYQYIGGAWSAISAGSTQSDASTTVAGKVEVATSAESIAGTSTGGTGASLVVTPDLIAANTQSGTFVYAAISGTDTYTCSLTPTLTTYTVGMEVRGIFTNTNATSTPTININSLGAKHIATIDGTGIAIGALFSGQVYSMIYDGTSFVLQKQDLGIFGDGIDADPLISSGTTTLSRDMFYRNLTISGTGVLNPNGYRVYVKGTLNNSSSGGIVRNGNNGAIGTVGTTGSGGAGGAALSAGSLNADIGGSAGGNATSGGGTDGTAGTASNPSYSTVNGVAGGAGGASHAGDVGGAGGGAGASTRGSLYQTVYSAEQILALLGNPASYGSTANVLLSVGTQYKGIAGSGGGGAGGVTLGQVGYGAGGGGGGGNGGVIWIAANNFINTGTISATGGTGGAGATATGINCGGGGGGGGGNGGIFYLICRQATLGTITLTKGTGGAGGSPQGSGVSGTAGTNGNDGVTIQITI